MFYQIIYISCCCHLEYWWSGVVYCHDTNTGCHSNIGHLVRTHFIVERVPVHDWSLLTTTGRHLLIFSGRQRLWPVLEKMLMVWSLCSAHSRHTDDMKNNTESLHESTPASQSTEAGSAERSKTLLDPPRLTTGCQTHREETVDIWNLKDYKYKL